MCKVTLLYALGAKTESGDISSYNDAFTLGKVTDWARKKMVMRNVTLSSVSY